MYIYILYNIIILAPVCIEFQSINIYIYVCIYIYTYIYACIYILLV